MKTSSAKAKGRKLQDWVVAYLREKHHRWLENDDIKPALMGESGEDVKLSPAARKFIPYSFECKNVEKLNTWTAYDQAVENSKGYTPIVIIKKNGRKPLAVLDAKYLLGLL